MQPSLKKPKVTPEQALKLTRWYADGRQVRFIQECLGRNPWRLQQEIIEATFKYKVTAVKSCNAAGKSDVASDIALAFLQLKPRSIVITTAPTWRQVKDVLWRYIRTKYNSAPVRLSSKQCNQVGLEYSDNWYAVGLSTKDSEKFFGYHADDVLVIVDEASGVEEEIYVGVDAVTPNINAHVLMIGNPTNPDGRFYNAFQDPLVKKFTISVFDTPNFTANGITDLNALLELFTPPIGVPALEHLTEVQKNMNMPIPALISPEAAYRRYLRWGPEHPMWEALIMGEFPSQATTSLIPLGLILKSRDVWLQMNKYDELEKKSLTSAAAKKEFEEYAQRPEWNIQRAGLHEYGLDVARQGDDQTVLIGRDGGYVESIRPTVNTWSKTDLVATSDRVIEAMSLEDWQARIKVDDTGLGGGVTDTLNRYLRDNENYKYQVVPINFSTGTRNPNKWFNLRAEMFDTLADKFRNHEIAIPDDEDLIAELATIRVKYVGKDANIIQIESKQQIKDRLKRSPDKADALALAFAKGPVIRQVITDQDIMQEERERERRESTVRPVTAGISRSSY